MENSKEKPKKKKFSLFCCFSTNGGKRRRRENNRSPNTSNSNKTNITEQNVYIKVKNFSIEDNSKNLEKQKFDENSRNSPISNIKKNFNNFENIKKNDNNNNQNKPNNNKTNLTRFNTLNNRINEERNLMPNINNSKDKKMSVNEYNYLNSKNRNYFLNNSELSDNNIFTNKESIKKDDNNLITDKISFNFNQKEIYLNTSSSIKDKIKPNLDNIENDDTVNIYDNNSSLNVVGKIDQNNTKEKKGINNITSNNDLKLSSKNKNKNNINVNNGNQWKNNDGKNRTDSIVFNDRNKTKDIDTKYNNYSSVSIPYNKNNNKFDTSTVMKNYYNNNKNYGTNIFNDRNKDNKLIIEDIKPSFSKNSNRIKYSNSLKSVKHVKMEKLGSAIDYNTRTGKYSVTNFENNNIYFNYNKQMNKIFKEENKINDKEKTISINSKKDVNQNLINNETNKINIETTPAIENNLKYINEDYFVSNTKKFNPDFNEEEKFIIENANSDIDEPTNENKRNIKDNNLNNDKKKEIIKEDEENIKDFEVEIEDEQDDIDEESRKINDSKSIISNYIVAPLTGINDLRSYAPSLCSKSEFKDNISNINDLTSNKDAFLIPPGLNETEIEIMNENGKEFKSFIETPRASGTYNKRFTHKNINFNTTNNTNIKYCSTNNKSVNQKMKSIYDRINSDTKEIQKINEKIVKIDEKIKIHEEFNKKYELWIEKEEEESEFLINMINFLNSYRK